MNQSALTAKNVSMVSCHSCHLLSRMRSDHQVGRLTCPRCGASLHQRKANSISRTWALVIAALICYIPANVLPITHVTTFGKVQSDTIMSGVIYFVVSGSWPIALVIFVASVFVPLVKLFILTFLLISVQRKTIWRQKDRTHLYGITEAIGRWSMVDIYVVTILVALVKMGALATIDAGPGAVFFGAVVVITIFAAMAFDPRLIWDAKEQQDE